MEGLQIEEDLGMPIYLSRISGCVQYSTCNYVTIYLAVIGKKLHYLTT